MYLQATSLATVAKGEYAILLVSSLRYGLWGHIYYQSVLTKTKADFKTNATNSVAVWARPRALKTRSHDRTSNAHFSVTFFCDYNYLSGRSGRELSERDIRTISRGHNDFRDEYFISSI